MNYLALFRDVKANPDRYIAAPTLDALAPFVNALDVAYGRGLLLGFQEWLAVMSGDGRDLPWRDLVTRLAGASGSDRDVFDRTIDLLLEFWTMRASDDEAFYDVFRQLAKLAPSAHATGDHSLDEGDGYPIDDFPTQLATLRASPDRYGTGATFDAMAAFVLGIHAGQAWTLLIGFDEFVWTKARHTRNLSWSGRVLHVAFPDHMSARPMLTTPEAHRHAIETMLDLLQEFWSLRKDPRAFRRIYFQYLGLEPLPAPARS